MRHHAIPKAPLPFFHCSALPPQLSDIVHVWAVIDYTATNSLQRELVMVKVAYLPPTSGGDFKVCVRLSCFVSRAA